MPSSKDAVTSPQTPVTLGQLRDAIFERLAEHEDKLDKRIDALEAKSVERHATILETLQRHEHRLNAHDTDIKDLRDGRFPQLPLWALVAVCALGLLVVIVFGSLIFYSLTHVVSTHAASVVYR